ncbi:MAG: hypothetical protein ACKVG0_15740 [Alphaproteobacteria bacterium]|jgi:hypothetical protein
MGLLFRALIGFSIAFYASDSVTARSLWGQYVVYPISARCAQGLTICDGLAAHWTAEEIALPKNEMGPKSLRHDLCLDLGHELRLIFLLACLVLERDPCPSPDFSMFQNIF